jgi:hypothetical protein
MAIRLSDLELDVLRKIVNGESVTLSSNQRFRLELAGVVKDGARGIAATPEGRRLATQARSASTEPETVSAPLTGPRDRIGRRMPLQRKPVF